ncbi:MAG: hypothetical protein ACI8QZ_000727 [Chlamydiales bacterium]
MTVLPLVQGGSETRSFGKPQLSLEYTSDTRGYNTLNLTGSTPLRYQWNLWGLIDLHSTDGGPTAERVDTSRYFLELDLKRKLWTNAGIIFEVNDFAGDENVLGRAEGFYMAQAEWLSDHDAKLYFKVFPYETDGHGAQASFAFAKRFPGFAEDRWSIGGFLDANFDAGPLDDDTIIVTETRVRYEYMDGLNLFA